MDAYVRPVYRFVLAVINSKTDVISITKVSGDYKLKYEFQRRFEILSVITKVHVSAFTTHKKKKNLLATQLFKKLYYLKHFLYYTFFFLITFIIYKYSKYLLYMLNQLK